MARRPHSVRALELTRAAWGLGLLCRPREILSHVHGLQVDRRSVVVGRILGARHLAQAVGSGVRPSPEVLALGIWVDTVHAGSAVGLAVVDRNRARAGLVDTVAAAGWAAAGWYDLTRGRPTPPRHEWRRDVIARAVLRLVPGGGPLRRRAAAERAAWGTEGEATS